MATQSTKPVLSPQLGHIAMLLEALLAEARFLRGLSAADETFRERKDADYQKPLRELQDERRALFG